MYVKKILFPVIITPGAYFCKCGFNTFTFFKKKSLKGLCVFESSLISAASQYESSAKSKPSKSVCNKFEPLKPIFLETPLVLSQPDLYILAYTTGNIAAQVYISLETPLLLSHLSLYNILGNAPGTKPPKSIYSWIRPWY